MNEHELYEDRQKKIAEYPELLLVISYWVSFEKFIDEKLKVDLKHILDYRDTIYEQMAK
jgi:hypothetical protein